MVDKAFLVGVDDLQELCEELKDYSVKVKPGSVTITRHVSHRIRTFIGVAAGVEMKSCSGGAN
jgi:hypothetical protein